MLGCFSDLNHTWLVTEFADGGELFDVVCSNALTLETKKRYAWEMTRAVAYLHRHHIGHRDISLENVLIKDDTVKLMDFGLAVRSHSPSSGIPLRFFRPAGKNFYRAPECYVPMAAQVQVTVPTDALPGDVVMLSSGNGYLSEFRLPMDCTPSCLCTADVWGYAVRPADIFSLGMSIFVLYCGFPLWKQALLIDPTFTFVHKLKDRGLAALLRRWQKPFPPHEVMQLFKGMLRTDVPSKRLTAEECLESSLLFQAVDDGLP
jgi:serine/threonine protein kinase